MATYNVSPDKAGIFFGKIQCFCFEQQRIEPGQILDMPVLFTVSPDILKDPLTKDLKTLTLSYTFFEYRQ
jgi:cytochrome c oxidase assembly protein subunit 11